MSFLLEKILRLEHFKRCEDTRDWENYTLVTLHEGKVPRNELPAMENGIVFPNSPDDYQLYLRTDEGSLYIYLP